MSKGVQQALLIGGMLALLAGLAGGMHARGSIGGDGNGNGGGAQQTAAAANGGNAGPWAAATCALSAAGCPSGDNNAGGAAAASKPSTASSFGLNDPDQPKVAAEPGGNHPGSLALLTTPAEPASSPQAGTSDCQGVSKDHRVALLGDSITAIGDGYAPALRSKLGAGWCVQNFGISGQQVKSILARVVDGTHPQQATDPISGAPVPAAKQLHAGEFGTVVVLAGVNGIGNLPQTKEGLSEIYQRLKSDGARVVAVSLTPWDGWSRWNPSEQANTDAVNQWLASKPSNVDTFVDVNPLLTAPGDHDRLNPIYAQSSKGPGDGLHPNSAGTAVIGNAVFTGAFAGR